MTRSWLEIQGDIDGLLWQAGEVDKMRRSRAPINRMIDEAAGIDAAEDAEFKAAIEALTAELKCATCGFESPCAPACPDVSAARRRAIEGEQL